MELSVPVCKHVFPRKNAKWASKGESKRGQGDNVPYCLYLCSFHFRPFLPPCGLNNSSRKSLASGVQEGSCGRRAPPQTNVPKSSQASTLRSIDCVTMKAKRRQSFVSHKGPGPAPPGVYFPPYHQGHHEQHYGQHRYRRHDGGLVVEHGYMMSCPLGCPPALYDRDRAGDMWHSDPVKRLPFLTLQCKLEDFFTM
ncbi:hypothetical protein MRX96_012271 [Rhipicephalus microplus]